MQEISRMMLIDILSLKKLKTSQLIIGVDTFLDQSDQVLLKESLFHRLSLNQEFWLQFKRL